MVVGKVYKGGEMKGSIRHISIEVTTLSREKGMLSWLKISKVSIIYPNCGKCGAWGNVLGPYALLYRCIRARYGAAYCLNSNVLLASPLKFT